MNPDRPPHDAAHAAHDLRNLLSAVTGHAELLLHALKHGDADERALTGGLEAVRLSAAQAATVCDELLSLARGETVEHDDVELAAVARHVRELFRVRAGSSVPLRLQGQPHARVRGHAQALQRAILNLLWNALDAVRKLERPAIVLRWGGGEHEAWIEVADNGPGLPSGHLGDLSEPFRSTRAGSGPRGLGLHSVARVMREHGGRLVGRNAAGGGAILRLEFGIERELDFEGSDGT